MNKTLMALALLSAISTANAGNDNANPCGNNGNNCNTGGAGGNGTGVGIGVGVGYGQGGNSNSTSNSTGGNATGGTAIAVGGSSDVDVRNSSTNVNGNSNTNKVESSNVQGQIQGMEQGQSQSTNNANNSTTSVNVAGDTYEQRRIPVNTAFAPSIPPTANCAIPVTGGFTNAIFSLSGGSAYIDKNCVALERVRNVALVLGDIVTAEALQCMDKDYAKARLTIGRPCPVEQE